MEEKEAYIEGKKLDFDTSTKKRKKKIKVKQYNPDTLDKYLLTVCKALQQKVDELEARIEKLESKEAQK